MFDLSPSMTSNIIFIYDYEKLGSSLLIIFENSSIPNCPLLSPSYATNTLNRLRFFFVNVVYNLLKHDLILFYNY